MNETEFNKFREAHSQLSNGQILHLATYTILSNMELTILELTALDGLKNSTGDFNPSDGKLFINFLEVLTLANASKQKDLLALLRKLPSSTANGSGSADISWWFIDKWGDKIFDRGIYFSRDRDYLDGRLDSLDSEPIKRGIDGLELSNEWRELLESRDKQFKRMVANGETIEYAPIVHEVEPKPIEVVKEVREPSEVEIEEIMPMEDIPSKGWVNRGGKDD